MKKRRGNTPSRRTSPLRIIPLGGLGEFGLNCLLVECGSDSLVIDVGLMFPEPELLGIDYVIPDFSYLFETAANVRGIFLTHGHEDHIGALPYLMDRVSAPVYGTDLTLGMVRGRLREHGLDPEERFRPVRHRERISCGNLEVEILGVNHSIPGAFALAIRTPEGTILHTADFKLDLTPVDGKGFDFQAFIEARQEGILVLLSDSTNAERSGFTPSEQTVGEAFQTVFRQAHGRILVATFASHIHRVQQILDLASRFGKKVGFVGRSLHNNLKVAASLGYVKYPPDTVCDPGEIRQLPPDKTVLVVTGSQGEPMSALSRIALDRHKEVQLRRGDLVILSARSIPGNEKAISRMVDHLSRRVAEVLNDPKSPLHVSGHACQEELKIMLNLCQPEFFIPIHGNYRQLACHAELAARSGIPRDRILLTEDGQIVQFRDGRLEEAGRVQTGRVFIDTGLGEVGEIVIRDRQHLSEDGIIMAMVVIDQQTGEMQGDSEIISRGFTAAIPLDQVYRDAAARVRTTVEGSSAEERSDLGVIRAKIQTDLKRYFRKTLKRHPMILPVIMET
ncbi:MAG: ribonuclease J [Acidobacteriota bacterium]